MVKGLLKSTSESERAKENVRLGIELNKKIEELGLAKDVSLELYIQNTEQSAKIDTLLEGLKKKTQRERDEEDEEEFGTGCSSKKMLKNEQLFRRLLSMERVGSLLKLVRDLYPWNWSNDSILVRSGFRPYKSTADQDAYSENPRNSRLSGLPEIDLVFLAMASQYEFIFYRVYQKHQKEQGVRIKSDLDSPESTLPDVRSYNQDLRVAMVDLIDLIKSTETSPNSLVAINVVSNSMLKLFNDKKNGLVLSKQTRVFLELLIKLTTQKSRTLNQSSSNDDNITTTTTRTTGPRNDLGLFDETLYILDEADRDFIQEALDLSKRLKELHRREANAASRSNNSNNPMKNNPSGVGGKNNAGSFPPEQGALKTSNQKLIEIKMENQKNKEESTKSERSMEKERESIVDTLQKLINEKESFRKIFVRYAEQKKAIKLDLSNRNKEISNLNEQLTLSEEQNEKLRTRNEELVREIERLKSSSQNAPIFNNHPPPPSSSITTLSNEVKRLQSDLDILREDSKKKDELIVVLDKFKTSYLKAKEYFAFNTRFKSGTNIFAEISLNIEKKKKPEWNYTINIKPYHKPDSSSSGSEPIVTPSQIKLINSILSNILSFNKLNVVSILSESKYDVSLDTNINDDNLSSMIKSIEDYIKITLENNVKSET